VSKQFTALAVVLLAQDGKLSLDDAIQKYLPEVPRYSRPVTIRHLLHHTSGLRDYIDLLGWSGVQEESVTNDRDALAILARQQAPNFEAGAEYLYSNSGFFLLSVIVRRASGKSLRAFAAERIFGPLGMRHSFYLDDHSEIVPDKAGSYAPHGQGFQLALANWEQTGDGAVQTSVEDLLQWERNFGSGAVGGDAAIRALDTPGVLNNGTAINYALGQVVDEYRGLRRISHGGSWAGFRAYFMRFPEQHTAISVLCNVANGVPSVSAAHVADLVLAQSFTQAAPATPGFTPIGARPATSSRPLGDYVGRYHSEELLADWELYRRGDSLRVRVGPLVDEPVEFVAAGVFILGARAEFLETNGQVSGVALTSRGARNFRLLRVMQ
jgi:CubicO group peptidase (beta-lactamase class C family)